MSPALKFHIFAAFILAVMFTHFAGAGARTFKYNTLFDEGGAQANAYFQVTVLIVLVLAVFYRIEPMRGIAALVLVACSVTLYVHAARIEERNLLQGPLGAAYAQYKSCTGMLLLLPARSARASEQPPH